MKILVIQQKMIGDVLVSSLICENLKLNYPNAEIHYLVNRFTIPVIENNPYINKVVVFEDEYRSSKLAFYKFLKNIRRAKYDIVIDAYGKLESNLISLFSGAKTKVSWKKKYTKFIYSHTIDISKTPKTRSGLAIDNRLKLLSPLNLKSVLRSKPKIYLSESEIERAKSKLEKFNLDLSRPLYMIGVLGSDILKTYPSEFMVQILDHIVDYSNAQLIFNYIPYQKQEVLKIYNLCQDKTKENIYLGISGDSIREFISITSHCDALIGNEGGAVNMAKAIDIPTFTIFSPWIDKETWSSFEDGKKNVSIHLDEIIPSYFEVKRYKDLKPKSLELYKKLEPKFVIHKLNSFIDHINH
ncbi:MAG: glycosyltransferase family 9 protein [Psychroflexus sp.]